MKILLDGGEIARTLERLAYQILERHSDLDGVMILGIQRRGVDIAGRVADLLAQRTGVSLPIGSLDINLYRDDWTSRTMAPEIGSTSIPGPVEGKIILLVDDVLFTGRTVRAALEAIADYGRPKAVELLVLVDRGHRELPIQADYTGRKIGTSLSEKVNVYMSESDGRDEVCLSRDGEE